MNEIKIILPDTLNRAEILTTKINNSNVHFSILYNKKNSGLEVYIDDINKNKLDKNKTKLILHRNVERCLFTRTFINTDNFSDTRVDYRNKFLSIKEEQQSKIFSFMFEIKKFKRINPSSEREASNYLKISGWKCFDLEDDLIYYFVERKVYNPQRKISILRTLSIQFSTENGYNYLKNLNQEVDN
jgi:hypothetical protein